MEIIFLDVENILIHKVRLWESFDKIWNSRMKVEFQHWSFNTDFTVTPSFVDYYCVISCTQQLGTHTWCTDWGNEHGFPYKVETLHYPTQNWLTIKSFFNRGEGNSKLFMVISKEKMSKGSHKKWKEKKRAIFFYSLRNKNCLMEISTPWMRKFSSKLPSHLFSLQLKLKQNLD